MNNPADRLLKDPAVALYLDLLKRSLTDTIFKVEPDVDQEEAWRWVPAQIQHYVRGPAVSMLPLSRMDNIRECVSDVIGRGVPGDLIEAGVWRGGAAIYMRGILKALDVRDRIVWVADSFEGLPEPDAERFPAEAKTFHGAAMQKAYQRLAVALDEVKRNFEAYGLLDDQVRFLRGWFQDSLPSAPIDKLAVLRLDADFYQSTMDALQNLYDKLSVGGFAIIDDYAEDDWTYCRKAVDEFRASRGIAAPMVRVDSKCYYWRREA